MGAGGRTTKHRRALAAAGGDVRFLAVAFTGGVAAIHALAQLPPLWLFLPLLAACLRPWPGRNLLLAAVVGAGWTVWQADRLQERRLPVAAHGSERVLTGHVEGLPETDAIRTRFQFVTGERPHRVRVSWYRDAPELVPGACWRLTLKLSTPRGSLNPGGFDYEAWLWRQRIGATGYVRAAEPCAADRWTLDRWRQSISNRVDTLLDGRPAAALVRALAVGDRGGITDDQWQVLRRTGTSHLVAISGLHVGLIAALAFFLLRWLAPRLPGGHRLSALSVAAVGAGLAAAGYAALAGFALPTQRALLMIAVVLGAVLVRRRTAPSRLLALAALAVLALDPFAVLAPGFWLSFGAVAWILYLVRGRVGGAGRWRFWLWLQPALVLGLMPLTLFWFGEASLAAPLANALLIPAFAAVVPAVLLTTVAATAAPAVAGPALGWIADALGAGWAGLAWLADLPLSHFSLPAPGIFALVAALGGVALLLAPRGVPGRWLGAVMLLPLFVPPPAPPTGGYSLTVLDVGQGLSTVVRTERHALLFDAGPRYRTGFDTGEAIVLPYLNARGIGRLDRAVISHGDIDHRGGWPAVRDRVEVGAVLGAGVDRPCRRGQSWLWDGVRFTMLHPAEGGLADNDASCVLRIDGPGGSALLTGDIERAAERRLLARGALLGADVLVVPHHGSKSSSSAAFVRRVAPEYAVVPAGWRNRWGFPDPAVVSRYRAIDAEILQTGELGAIRFEFDPRDGVSPPRAWRDRVRRFWH